MKNSTKSYTATGYVLGKLWGGGIAAYPSSAVCATTKKELLKKANKMLDSGSLDSGMGFEYLQGAILNIEIRETITYKDKKYQRSDYEEAIIGEVSKEELDWVSQLD